MIVRIAEKTGIGQHEGRVALVPEGSVVTEPDLVDLFGKADRKEW